MSTIFSIFLAGLNCPYSISTAFVLIKKKKKNVWILGIQGPIFKYKTWINASFFVKFSNRWHLSHKHIVIPVWPSELCHRKSWAIVTFLSILYFNTLTDWSKIFSSSKNHQYCVPTYYSRLLTASILVDLKPASVFPYDIGSGCGFPERVGQGFSW